MGIPGLMSDHGRRGSPRSWRPQRGRAPNHPYDTSDTNHDRTSRGWTKRRGPQLIGATRPSLFGTVVRATLGGAVKRTSARSPARWRPARLRPRLTPLQPRPSPADPSSGSDRPRPQPKGTARGGPPGWAAPKLCPAPWGGALVARDRTCRRRMERHRQDPRAAYSRCCPHWTSYRDTTPSQTSRDSPKTCAAGRSPRRPPAAAGPRGRHEPSAPHRSPPSRVIGAESRESFASEHSGPGGSAPSTP